MTGTIYTSLPREINRPQEMLCLGLKELERRGYSIEFRAARIHGAYVWCDWSRRVLLYNWEDSPDRPHKTASLLGWVEQIYELLGGVNDRQYVQVWPNANTDVPSVAGWSRVRDAPYPVARPYLLEPMRDWPFDPDAKRWDIYASWSYGGGGTRLGRPEEEQQYRFKITERAARHEWGSMSGGIWLRAGKEFGGIRHEWHNMRTTGRIRHIDGPAFDSDVWVRYMTHYMRGARVGFDSMGNLDSPYCHRFIEAGWGGVCIIRNGPACDWYEPGVDYLIEPEGFKAWELGLEMVRSGEWEGFARNLNAKWRKHETTPAVAAFILEQLEEG